MINTWGLLTLKSQNQPQWNLQYLNEIKVFLLFGIPSKVGSDNGSPIDCSNFSKYAKYLGFIHQPITPAYSKANRLVENVNRMICKVLCTARIQKLKARTL